MAIANVDGFPDGFLDTNDLVPGRIYKAAIQFNPKYWFFVRFISTEFDPRHEADIVSIGIWGDLRGIFAMRVHPYQTRSIRKNEIRFYDISHDFPAEREMIGDMPPSEEIIESVRASARDRRKHAVMAWTARVENSIAAAESGSKPRGSSNASSQRRKTRKLRTRKTRTSKRKN